MTIDSSTLSLRDHLIDFGIQAFQDDSYWTWGGEKLGEKRSAHLNKLRKPLMRGKPQKADLFAFYEFIATAEVAAVVHSMKADAIRATGEFVASRIQGPRILDTGCGIGYLTSWYALQKPKEKVLGIDFSPTSIEMAKRCATKRGITNLEFCALDGKLFSPTEPFDTIVDTQGMINPQLDSKGIQLMLSWLHPEGKLIAVPAFGDLPAFEAFLDKIDSDRVSILSLDWIHFSDLGERGMFPGIVMSHADSDTCLSKAQLAAAFRDGIVAFNLMV